MITAEWLYWVVGAFFLVVALLILSDPSHAKRWTSGIFWGLLGLCFFYGTFVIAETAPAWVLGIAVLVLVAIAGTGQLGKGTEVTTSPAEREASAERLRNRLFIPAITVPLVTVIVAMLGPKLTIGGEPVLATGTATLTGLGIGGLVALIVAFVLLRPPSLATPFREGARLLEAIGWAALLPQMLSTLGTLFTQAGVGVAVGDIAAWVVPEEIRFWAVVAYCVGMALFTIIMGNAFAAFPIMTAAIGWPILVGNFGGEPAAVFAMGMLAGFCGTLCTPMAANFNIVPAALLEMKDKYGPIKAQLPTAGIMLVVTTVFMYLFAF